MTASTPDAIPSQAHSAVESRASVKSLFAEFGVRMFAIGLDYFLASFLVAAVNDHVLGFVGLSSANHFPIALAALFLYFTVSWSSPLRATPAQLLLGMRVVDEAGESLSPGRALLRSLILVALFAATMTLVRTPGSPAIGVLSFVGFALVYLAVVTPNRQAAHDLLARSIVVNRKALVSTEQRERLLRHVADRDPASRKYRRPSLISMVIDTLVLVVPVFAILTVAQAQHDMDLRQRASYALSVVEGLKIAVATYHEEYARWPGKSSDLGHDARVDYPDGGYYELEDNGVIRIRFTVKPELKKGSIILSPNVGSGGITWKCQAEGGIANNHLPAPCRN